MRAFGRPTPEISVDELDDELKATGVMLVDVREDWEYRRGRVPGAVPIPLGQFAQRAGELPTDRRILVICEHGNRSLAAAEYLIRIGYPDAASVAGGTAAWIRSGRAVER